MKVNQPYKIVIIGPESTGKSSLCQGLAAHYNALWCPEYARAYLEGKKVGTQYTEEDLLAIAKGQLVAQDAYFKKATIRKDRFLFIDTDMYVMKTWSEFSFDRCAHWILEQIAERQYDYYLLGDIDLPWQEDPLREYPDPDMRKRLMLHYKDILIQQSTPFSIISGTGNARLSGAIQRLDNHFT